MTGRTAVFDLDRSVRRSGAGRRLLIGGSPLRLFRLTSAGARLFSRIENGDRTEATPAELSLIGRWVDAGLLHPRPDDGSGPFDAHDVTVVVPVRDRADGVGRLIESIRIHSPGVARVVVVDDGSTDPGELARLVQRLVGTVDLRERKRSDPTGPSAPIELLRRGLSGGPAAARNDGAVLVDTELIAFVDSDCTVAPHWLEPLLAQFGDPTVAVAAPRVCATVGRSVIERYDSVRSPLDMGGLPARVAPGTRVSYVPSAALVLRTDVWRSLDGFDAALSVGEDVDLIWRVAEIGKRVRFVPASIVHHAVRDDLVAFVRQRFGYGTSAAALDRRHPGQVAPVVMSPWSAAVWGLVAFGRPIQAATLAVSTTQQLHRQLPEVPVAEVARLGLGGHIGAGRQLAHATVRVWWPIALPAAIVSRRARRLVAAFLVWTLADAWREGRTRAQGPAPLDPVRFALLTLLDEMSYGAGVWAGCRRAGSFRALLPRLTRK